MMNEYDRQLQRAFDEINGRVNALSAIVSGLAAQIHQSQGEAGLQAAKEKALNAASKMHRPFGGKIDTQFVESVFDQAPQI